MLGASDCHWGIAPGKIDSLSLTAKGDHQSLSVSQIRTEGETEIVHGNSATRPDFFRSVVGRFSARSLLTSTAVSTLLFSVFYHFIFLPHWEIYSLKTKVENFGGRYTRVQDVLWENPSIQVSFRNVPLKESQVNELLPHLKRNPPHVLQLSGSGLDDQQVQYLLNELDRNCSQRNILVGKTILSANEIHRINFRISQNRK